MEFAEYAEEHLLRLHNDLKTGDYQHSSYIHFTVCDPKLRHIHKGAVRDRVLHHAIHRFLEPVFERIFIFDSYASRKEKGIHKAGKRFREFARKLSGNHTRTVWVLQCDIRKFFDSIDHTILLGLLKRQVNDSKTIELLEMIVQSFETVSDKGIPLGNLTSQLFANIYLNLLDQFVKRTLRVKQYIRYADDFALLSCDKLFLEGCLLKIRMFLFEELKLELHPKKVTLKKWYQGIDFLGYVQFPFYCVVQTKTRRRLFRRLNEKNVASYFGVTRHARAYGLESKMRGILEV